MCEQREEGVEREEGVSSIIEITNFNERIVR